jgi:transposase
MDEIIPVKTPAKRRRFSKAFKASLLAQCDQPGVSVASVAQAHKINANLLHKWRRLAKDKATCVSTQPDFLPVPLSVPVNDTSDCVIIEVDGVKLHWPLSYIDQSIAWLRALQA